MENNLKKNMYTMYVLLNHFADIYTYIYIHTHMYVYMTQYIHIYIYIWVYINSKKIKYWNNAIYSNMDEPRYYVPGASLMAQMVKKSSCNSGDSGSILGWEDTLEKGMATHTSILSGKTW